jgi:hypothetical protein
MSGEMEAVSFSFVGAKARLFDRPVRRLELVPNPCGQNEFVGVLTHVDVVQGVEAHKRIPWATLHRVPMQEYYDVIKPWLQDLPLAESSYHASLFL